MAEVGTGQVEVEEEVGRREKKCGRWEVGNLEKGSRRWML